MVRSTGKPTVIWLPTICSPERTTDMSYATINPYTGETLKTFPNTSDQEVSAAIDRAHAAFHAWREVPISARTAVLQKAAHSATGSR
jgi:acyl-CoA reductase-like NAD-dependent aldehyde dehydrogenase